MKRRKDILKFWLAVLMLLSISLFTITIVVHWHRVFPSADVNKLYIRYENVEGVNVSYVKKFKVNDTVIVDVTILEATDSVAWATLKNDFATSEPSPATQEDIDSGIDIIYVKLIPKSISTDSTTDSTTDSYPMDVLATSYLNRTLTIFHVNNEAESYIIRRYNYDKTINESSL